MSQKFKQKTKVDQLAADFINSLEYHRQYSVEVDLFYRFFTLQYTDQDLMFFLFARSLTERELQIKLTSMPVSFDITQLKINKKKVLKIAKVYFENIAGETEQAKTTAENLANHFLTSLVKGAQETQEMENELYDKLKGDIQVTFF